jgi:topoisomerase-4 subunit A
MTKPATAGDIREVGFADALGERYLSYALSTIISRSLPDVRDGLKPVHRRLLYAMRQLKLDPASGYKKCARVVGDVIGKFHPHGEVAVYDALVRLAQEFAQRYPLVDGQGNFGNIDGDNAAAMRYTESRLTAVAEALMQGIEENAVDFRATYDGENEEPVVLPARLPNLLANGAAGIAVGMATSIPPHNIVELCDALAHLVRRPRCPVSEIIELVPGPDFPTGGMLVEDPDAVAQAYESGRGSFRLRARWQKEALSHGLYQVVVTEIPYQVQKSRLIERIALLLQERKIALLEDVRDESTAEVRIVLEPRSRAVDPEVLMEALFRQTDLEIRFPLNMNVLDAEQTPRVMALPEVLQAYLDYRRIVLQRRSRFRLANIEHRLEVLGGYLIAYLNLDEVIRIVREEDEPRAVMIRRLKVSEVQADAILNMRLKSLRKLEEIEIRQEHAALTKEGKELGLLLKSEERQWQAIASEIAEIRKHFGPATALGRRRTHTGEPPKEIAVPVEAMIEREAVTVICSDKGWIRAQRGQVGEPDELKYKEGDRGRFILPAETTDKLVVFGTNGRFYTIGVDKLPGGRGHGEPIRLMIELGNDQELVAVFVHKPGRKLLVASADGRGFIVPEDEVVAQTRAGKQVLNLAEGVEAAACTAAEGDTVAVIGENRKLLLFPLADLPEMTRGRGVILQRYKDGGLSDVKCFAYKEGLTWRQGERQRSETALAEWRGERGQAGRLPPQGFTRSNKFG